MIKRIDIGDMTIVVIGSDDEAVPKPCTDCGKVEELRPYGRDAAWVCFDCAMKDPVNAEAMFEKQLKGDS